MRKLLLLLACLAASASLAACGGDDDTTGGTGAATDTTAAASCEKASLTLKTAGTLTLGTDNPAFPPWFGGGEKNKPWEINDPSTGEGYESAVAYAVAGKLGFTQAEVKWNVVKFDTSFAPGPKDFDAFINQVSITPERAQNVELVITQLRTRRRAIRSIAVPTSRRANIACLRCSISCACAVLGSSSRYRWRPSTALPRSSDCNSRMKMRAAQSRSLAQSAASRTWMRESSSRRRICASVSRKAAV